MIKFTYLKAAAGLCLLIALVSCSRDKGMVSATVLDTQNIAKDSGASVLVRGCGFLLVLPDKALIKPTYMPSLYQHDGLKVKVRYTHTGIADTCNYGTKIYDLVSIQDIQRDLN